MALDDTLQHALQACRAPAAEAYSIPPRCYTDATVEALEVEQLFRQGWIGVGRADLVKAPGDFVALDLAGQAIILLRDIDGGLRAFANTCRHRGARLVEGQGTCRGLRCPFHSWFYGLDGRLVAAPEMDAVEGFDKADYGLKTYRAEERLGFAFICLNPDAPALDTVLAEFPAIHAPWPLENLVTTRRREMVVGCNWKAFLEVFNEYYHLPFVHADSIDDVYLPPDVPDPVQGAFATQFGPTEGTGGLLQDEQDKALPPMPGLSGRAAEGVRYTWVFPNMTFAAGRDALWVYEAYPLGPNQCRVIQTACFPRETLDLTGADEALAAYHIRLDAAIDEDIPALENQQRGLASPDAAQGRFQPLLEANVARFAAWYSDTLLHSKGEKT
ncbi:aromatic ring-hydroxylating oxygenase subunit alpha [Roseovarius rhodophyticola]|uniref:Aromatic ring-hydroxylating dioxygenase subunit alpha n=1 Tax=Roseovarius rhodophyticola TaxID=3080827 RepID=A0ABZ2TCB9_9RHOB|nr:aromatic ring-hydroxylating dioxygenase subunit alpha [Roseovarius sp. W115]MDV2931071.1 aromatic ring-hydroxylating dioxygenase subunit alpha [Roseovarius sp. W115]